MGEGASPVLGPPRPPPQGRGGLLHFGMTMAPATHGRAGLLRFGTIEAPAAWAMGPSPFSDRSSLRRMGKGACATLGSPMAPPRRRGGLLRFGTTGATNAWARGPPPFWYHREPHHRG